MARSIAWSRLAKSPELSSDAGRVDRDQIIRRLERLSWLLDDAARIPGTRITLGWDSVLGIVPGIGDAITTAVSAYFLWEANRLGLSTATLVKMLGNVGVDFVVGTVPVVGDLVDIGWRANRRNLQLLYRELGITHKTGKQKRREARRAS
jgi:Domain of unknown function (DUF4112)